MVEVWEIAVVFVSVLIAVLSVYGHLIKEAHDVAGDLDARLFANDRDADGGGFVYVTRDRLDELEHRADVHEAELDRLDAVVRKSFRTTAYSIDDLVDALEHEDVVEIPLGHIRIRDDERYYQDEPEP